MTIELLDNTVRKQHDRNDSKSLSLRTSYWTNQGLQRTQHLSAWFDAPCDVHARPWSPRTAWTFEPIRAQIINRLKTDWEQIESHKLGWQRELIAHCYQPDWITSGLIKNLLQRILFLLKWIRSHWLTKFSRLPRTNQKHLAEPPELERKKNSSQ